MLASLTLGGEECFAFLDERVHGFWNAPSFARARGNLKSMISKASNCGRSLVLRGVVAGRPIPSLNARPSGRCFVARSTGAFDG